MGRVTSRRPVLRIVGTETERMSDALAVEEPLELRVNGRPVSVTMRTPGHDVELAIGFLLTEGVITDPGVVREARYCPGASNGQGNTYNVLDLHLSEVTLPTSVERSFYTTSSCGVCGKSSIEAIRTRARWRLTDDATRVDPATLTRLPAALRSAQRVFDRTGGLHAAGLFATDGGLLAVREDVGRHNAVDKVVGWAARDGRLPLRGTILLVSGRASFELAQKALMAGIPVLAAVSAPSSLAVELAAEADLTLVGFLRGETMNVYAGAERLTTSLAEVR